MYVLNKKRNEIVELDISGRIFIRDTTVYCGRTDEKPSYLGDYESGEQAKMALRLLFEALKNPQIHAFEMPLENDVKSRLEIFTQNVERHHKKGKKTKGHGGS